MRISKVISAKAGELVVLDEDDNTIRRKGGTVAWRCNNPGNLKFGPFAQSMGAVGKDALNHAVFATDEHGLQAQYVLLFDENSPYWNLTLLDAIKRYAPTGDGNNNPIKYQTYITGKTGIAANTKIKNTTIEQKLKMLEAMGVYEGYKAGKDYKVSNV
jgi:hypothetical protein